ASTAVGFSSFALVLGYRYVDPLHALATLLLLPFFLLALRGHAPHPTAPHTDLCNDHAWLRAQWGQLALVALGVGFLVGGVTIAIHLAVDYDNPVHLAPVGLALTLWTVGLVLCRVYCWDVKGTSAQS